MENLNLNADGVSKLKKAEMRKKSVKILVVAVVAAVVLLFLYAMIFNFSDVVKGYKEGATKAMEVKI